MKLVENSHEFKDAVLSELGFSPHIAPHSILYTNDDNPEYGYLRFYERPGFYSFGVADYTIPHDFHLSFHNEEQLVRFGTVYKGLTNVSLEDAPLQSFSPSSFFVIEQNISGMQEWKKNQHYHGAEFTIHKKYFKDVIEDQLGTDFCYEKFIENYTYRFLPLSMISIIESMQAASQENRLSPILLESYVLKCISIITETIESSANNDFSNQVYYGKVKLGSNKYLHLSPSDILSLQKARDILIQEIASPPTIESLSQLVLLPVQKLKAGFAFYYHMPIGKFITSTRMAIAANLLCTSEDSIAIIGQQVGYPYPSNFIKMFRKTYMVTPLEYRMQKGL